MYLTLEQKKARRAEIALRLKAIVDASTTETRDLTKEEEAEADKIKRESLDLRAAITRDEEMAALIGEPSPGNPPAPGPDLGTPGNPAGAPAVRGVESRAYSLHRAIRALVSNDWSDADVERRMSHSISELVNETPQGIYIHPGALLPEDQQPKELRAVAKGGTGGNLVETALIPQEFITLLRNMAVTARAGLRMIPNLVGDLDISRQVSGSAVGWVAAEGGDVGTSQPEFDLVSFRPKMLGVRVPITRRMLKQSTPAVEGVTRDDINEQIGIAIDFAVLAGDGVGGAPVGILNTVGVGAVTLPGIPKRPDWAAVVELETRVKAANALQGRLAYMEAANSSGHMKVTVKDSGGSGAGGFILPESATGTLNGHPNFSSEQVPDETMIFGNFADAALAMWGGLDLWPDNVTLGDSGGMVLRGMQDVDVQLRRPQSFAVAS